MMILRIALLSLAQHRRRTGVLAIAIAGVMALLLVMLGLVEGMNRSLVEASTTLMSGHLNVAGFYKVTSGQAAPVVTRANEVAEVVRREVPELRYMVQRGRGFARVVSDTGSMMLGLTGVSIDEERDLQTILKVKEGRLEDLKRPKSVLIFEEQAAQLGVRVGDQLTLSAPTPRGVNNTLDVTVVAVAANLGMMSQFSCFLNAGGLHELYRLTEHTTGALQLYLPTSVPAEIDQIEARLRQALRAAGFELLEKDPRAFWFKFDNVQRESWVGQRLDLTNWHDEVSFAAWTVDLMAYVAFFLATLLLQVVGVGIMIVMWMSIRERTREIGTLRAIGMQRHSVALMFLAEGFLLGLIAVATGGLAGLGLSALVNALQIHLPTGAQFVLLSEHLVVSPTGKWFAVAAVFICSVVTAISVIPAIVAARLKPVTAMSHVT